MFDGSKSKGNDFWFEESGVSNNRVFEKLGFHCNCNFVAMEVNINFISIHQTMASE